jgi:DNA-binding SARP family transcriptional activator
MLELSLLGLHALRGPGGRELTSLPAQSKRFALLAYLALGARTGYHRRDTLAALFWPDMDQFAARRALRNTLYHLREALGDNVIVTRGDDAVSINPAMLTCDVTLLHDAAAAGRFEDAVDRYHGELLAGFHVANAGEAFEEWLIAERRRVAAVVMQAIRALIDRDEQNGDLAGASYWAQRACTLAPGDESWLRRAMVLCDNNGDTGSALRLYEVFSRQLSAEFKATPSAECRALAAQIQSGARKRPAPGPVLRHDITPATSIAPAVSEPEVVRDDPPALPPTPSPPAEAPVKRVALARRRTVALAAVIVVGAAAVVALITRRTPRSPAVHERVLVAVFENHTGDSTLRSLGRMTQDWLSQGIVQTHLVDVVDPRAVYVQARVDSSVAASPLALARRTGAGLVVSGNYYRAGDTLVFQATLMDVPTGRLLRVVGPILSRIDTPLAALDDLRSRVMTALALAVDAHATQILGTGDPPSFEAYQDYVDGWDSYWHGDYHLAGTMFLQAAHRDTAFVAAGIAAAVAAANSNDCPLVDSLTRGLAARSQLTERADRLTLQVADARCHGRNDEMLRLTLERADLDPGNSSDQMSAVAAALWANRPSRALEMLQRINPAVDLEWSTDSTHFPYWSGLTEALHMLGRHRDELTAADRASRGAPLGRAWLRANALVALGRPTAALTILDSALTDPIETVSDLGLAPYTNGRPQFTMTPAWVANWVARELAFHGDTIAARLAAMRAVNWYRSRSTEERATPEERLIESWALESTGAWADAMRLSRGLVADDSTNVDFQGAVGAMAAQAHDTALADSADRWLAAQPVARVSWSASIYRARIAALLGRDDDAVARTRDAFDAGMWPRWLHEEPELARLSTRPDFRALTAPKNQ